MGLPFKRQTLGALIQDRELTYKQVARRLGCNAARVNSLILGRVYPTANEIEALERLIGLPVQNMFDDEVLKYFNPNGSLYSVDRRAELGDDQ